MDASEEGTCMDDPYDLHRFIVARSMVYRQVKSELAAGAKASHRMWFVFPQLGALGRSAVAKRFGIASMAEAAACWRHPVLGGRLKVRPSAEKVLWRQARCRDTPVAVTHYPVFRPFQASLSSRFRVARMMHAEPSAGSRTLNTFCSRMDFAMDVG
jgi:hypothetical protein